MGKRDTLPMKVVKRLFLGLPKPTSSGSFICQAQSGGLVYWLIKKEPFLSLFLFLLVVLTILHPQEIRHYPDFVDWHTIIALTGLLIITTGVKESEYFYSFLKKILKKLENERKLAITLILFSALLSTVLTNDITLFIVVPLTISMQDLIKNDISKLVIFEAISVNVGSTLTPIGNPQNLFLWQQWGISFMEFIMKMLPLVVILTVVLLTFALLAFPNIEIKFSEKSEKIQIDPESKTSLFYLSIFMLIIYSLSLAVKQNHLLLPVIFVIYFIFYRNVLIKTDWMLLLMFILMFIDFHLISTMPIIVNFVQTLNLNSPANLFLLSILSSQFMSNVPASIFLSKFSDNWYAITYGVNVGGNGFVLGSLANIIALRMAKRERIYVDFHKYSIPYLFITGGITYVLFFLS